MTQFLETVLSPFKPVMYVDGLESRVASGYRLAVVRWKATTSKDGSVKPAKPAVAVMVPLVQLSVLPEVLAVAMTGALCELQDAAIRSVLVKAIEADTGITINNIAIPESYGTPAGLATFAALEAVSGRLSSKSIEAWFDSNLSTVLLDAVLTNLPATDESAVVATRQVAKAREAITSLASPRTVMSEAVAKQLLKAVSMASTGDKMRGQLVEKLTFFTNPRPAEELLLAL